MDLHFERKQVGDHIKLLERQFLLQSMDFGEGEQKEREPQVSTAPEIRREGTEQILHNYVARPLIATAKATGNILTKTMEVTKEVTTATVNIVTTGSIQQEKKTSSELN